jgi:hypothetical protein
MALSWLRTVYPWPLWFLADSSPPNGATPSNILRPAGQSQ